MPRMTLFDNDAGEDITLAKSFGAFLDPLSEPPPVGFRERRAAAMRGTGERSRKRITTPDPRDLGALEVPVQAPATKATTT
jgi:hypothetical protein